MILLYIFQVRTWTRVDFWVWGIQKSFFRLRWHGRWRQSRIIVFSYFPFCTHLVNLFACFLVCLIPHLSSCFCFGLSVTDFGNGKTKTEVKCQWRILLTDFGDGFWWRKNNKRRWKNKMSVTDFGDGFWWRKTKKRRWKNEMSVTDFGDGFWWRIFLKHLFNYFLKEKLAKKNQRWKSAPGNLPSKIHLRVRHVAHFETSFLTPCAIVAGHARARALFSYLRVGR